MTPNEINQAIAEYCGWEINHYERDYHRWISPTGIHANLPNYCADLNAMHKAESVLEPKQKWEFSLRLIVMQENSTLTRPEDWAKLIDLKFKAPGFFAAIFATAAQRAEAFLKTVGKWNE